MNIALAQMEVIAKQPSKNFETMKKMIQQAKDNHVDCIVFGELVISGYLIGDTWFNDAFVSTCESYNDEIVKLADGIIIVWGNIATNLKKDCTHHSGRMAIYNCGFVAQNKTLIKRENGSSLPYIKHLLPNYRIFDDERYFVSGQQLSKQDMFSPFVVMVQGQPQKVGLEVCEDLWDEHYQSNPTQNWATQNLDVLINVSSSPWSNNKEKARVRHALNKSKRYQIKTFVYVNVVGMQNTGKNVVVFDGGSFICNHNGEITTQSNDSFYQELTLSHQMHKAITNNKMMDAIVYAIKAFDQQMFQQNKKWIVGLSGGIDSTVSIALLSKALGSHRIIAVNMPSKYNQSISINNAKQTAKNLNIEYVEHSIEKLVEATKNTLSLNDSKEHEFILENVQARVRGHLLSTLAALRNGVIVNNGNKVETALGYCTLYGDTIGALSPLGDCTKMQVFELAKQLNEYFENEIIPINLIPTETEHGLEFDFMPSAELKENQQDPMKWGYHDYLIEKITEYPTYEIQDIIQQVKTNNVIDSNLKKWLEIYNLTTYNDFINDLKWVLRQVELGVFKRIQMPPIVLVSRGAFGSDLRENQGLTSLEIFDI